MNLWEAGFAGRRAGPLEQASGSLAKFLSFGLPDLPEHALPDITHDCATVLRQAWASAFVGELLEDPRRALRGLWKY